MPSDHELEDQLRAFGETRTERTGEPIGRDGSATGSMKPTLVRRRWALIGAAACLVALVVGLVAFGSADEPESGQSLAGGTDSSGLGPLGALLGVGVVVDATVIGHRGPVSEANAFGGVNYPGRSEDVDGWTTPDGLPVVILGDVEVVEVIGGSDDADAVATSVTEAAAAGRVEVLAPVGVYALAERYQLWLSWYRDFGPMAYLAFTDAGVPVDGLGEPGLGSAIEVLIAHTGESPLTSLAALAREMNESAEGAPQGPLMDLVFGPRQPAPTAPVTTISPDDVVGDVPSRPITGAEQQALESDGSGLTCDAFGVGGWQWDYGPIDDTEPRGRRPVDAFWDALNEVRQEAITEGAIPPPLEGWTELIVSDGASVFVLELDGERQGRIDVSGDAGLGVWRHGSAAFCQALFFPEGFTPTTSLPDTTVPASPRQPPATTAPSGATSPVGPSVSVEWLPPGELITEIPPDEDVLVLMISNQSFEDDPVHLAVEIDGLLIADGAFEVGSQHTVTYHYVRGLAPGVHELTVVSDTGVQFTGSVTVNAGAPRWAFVTYWYYPNDGNGRFIDVVESDEPILID